MNPSIASAAPPRAIAHSRPPAKLNLFLELLGRRDDGYHEIDTVMVPIDWCDQLRLCRVPQAGITLAIDWLPSRQVIANRLGRPLDNDHATTLLSVPEDDTNLVSRALAKFIDHFEIGGGFHCELLKSIPAGAGMGGASSDAAAALRCAAKLCGVPENSKQLTAIAAEIGSDVPFFMGLDGQKLTAARATGRGERLQPIALTAALHFVVVFPGISLSTARVYAAARIPRSVQTADRIVTALESVDPVAFRTEIHNRLSDPARKLAPQIDETLQSLWRTGLRTCQLTGSGSACFAVTDSAKESRRIAGQLQAILRPGPQRRWGAIVMATRSTRVPARVEIH